MTCYILGVDPAKRSTGLAVLSMDGELIETCCHKESDLIEDTVLWLGQWMISDAIIEDQYLGQNPRSSLLVAKAHGYWTGICHMEQIHTYTVMASEWQSAMLGLGKRAKRQERKRKSIEFVEENFGVTLNEDEADAVCLACYHLETKCEL